MSSSLEAHYANLGLPLSADAHRIRAAYKQRSLQLHPDRPGGDADAFKTIHLSYTLLLRRVERKNTFGPTSSTHATYGGREAASRAPRPSSAGISSRRPKAATTTPTSAATGAQQIARPFPLTAPAKQPVSALLPDRRTVFVFDGHEDSIRHKGLRHGDVIKLSNGSQGCVIGVGGQRQCFWWPEGVSTAVFCGKVPFLFKLVGRGAGPAASSSHKGGRAGGTVPPTPTFRMSTTMRSNGEIRSDTQARTNGCFEGAFTTTASVPTLTPSSGPTKSIGKDTLDSSHSSSAIDEEKPTGAAVISGNPPQSEANTTHSSNANNALDVLIDVETRKRAQFQCCWEVYQAQCMWHFKLPTYASHDRVYNTQGSPLYK